MRPGLEALEQWASEYRIRTFNGNVGPTGHPAHPHGVQREVETRRRERIQEVVRSVKVATNGKS